MHALDIISILAERLNNQRDFRTFLSVIRSHYVQFSQPTSHLYIIRIYPGSAKNNNYLITIISLLECK